MRNELERKRKVDVPDAGDVCSRSAGGLRLRWRWVG